MSASETYWRGLFNAWHAGLDGDIDPPPIAHALDDARAIAAFRRGLGPGELAEREQHLWPSYDHIAFLRPLAPGDAVCMSGDLTEAEDGLTVMEGRLLTEPDGMDAARFSTGFRARDLASERPDITPVSAPENAWVSWHGTVETRDCDQTGLITPRAVCDLVMRGNAAIRTRFGRGQDRVLVLRIDYAAPARASDLLAVHSSFLSSEASSFGFGHLIRDEVSGRPVARASLELAAKQPPTPDERTALNALRPGT